MTAPHAQSISYPSVLVTSLLFLLASITSHQSGLDLWLADSIYQLEGGNGTGFPLRNNFLLQNVLHEGGRLVSQLLLLVTLAAYLASRFIDRIKPMRADLAFIVVATITACTSIAILKNLNDIPCPADLALFGGEREWVNFWQLFSSDLPAGKCYPAGHASGGYAWLAVAFIAPRRRGRFFVYLIPGLLLGLIFGVAQQLRGAHFLSHDLATIACCWFCSGTVFHIMRRPEVASIATPRQQLVAGEA